MDNAQVDKSKNYVFTWNNPTKSPEELNTFFEGFGATFLVFQKEKGEEGTPHYQGYVEFSRITRWVQINKDLPAGAAIWFARRRGSQKAAIVYCKKADTRLEGPWEFGEPRDTSPGFRTDLNDFRSDVQRGKRLRDLIEDHAPIICKYPRYYGTLRSMHMPVLRADGITVELHVGSTGTGKTRSIMEAYAGNSSFYASPLSGGFWMDGYDGHQIVLLDDFAGAVNKISLTQLLRLLDRYPVQVPVKCAFTWWHPRKIYITTNIHPRDWYKWDRREGQYKALWRRIAVLKVEGQILENGERESYINNHPLESYGLTTPQEWASFNHEKY